MSAGCTVQCRGCWWRHCSTWQASACPCAWSGPPGGSTISYHETGLPGGSRGEKSYLILSYLILSYLILSYLILSYLILSYLILSLGFSASFLTLFCILTKILKSTIHFGFILLILVAFWQLKAENWEPGGYKEMSSIWPIAPSYMSPNAGGGRGLRCLSQWVQLCTWSPNKLWRLNYIFNLCWEPNTARSIASNS